MELKESGVVFNEELHQYLLDGKELSGITGMIQRQLFPDEFEGVPEEMMMAAAEICKCPPHFPIPRYGRAFLKTRNF